MISDSCGLGQVTDQIEKSRLDELVAKLKDRTITPKELDEIAEGHLYLAILVTARYMIYRKRMSLDMLSEALYGMFEALLKAPDKLYDLEITPYIVTYMKKYVKKFITEDATIRVPDTSKRRKRVVHKYTSMVDEVPDTEDSIKQLRESIYASTRNDFEREVIKYREQQLKDRQIAAKLNCSREKVCKARRSVYLRFKKESECL